MKYNFDEVMDRRNTYSIKWEGELLKQFFGDENMRWDDETIPMMTADMDIACPPKLVEAMHRVADHRIYGYTMHVAEPRYNQSIVDWYKRRYDTEVKPEWIDYSDGSVTGINCAAKALSNVGDGVIIMRPVYGHFNGMIEEEMQGRKVVATHLINQDGYYTVDWEDFEAKCAVPTNRVFILCSPANPIGRVWTREELRRMVDICQKHDVLLISDEIHSDILRKGVKHHPIISVTEDRRNLVMVIGINKSFNVAGLHASNIIIPDDRLRGIFRKEFGMKMASPFTVAAQVAAYDECEDWLDELNEYLDANIDFAVDFIREHMPKVKVWKPEGTYMLWLDFRAYGLADAEVHDRIYTGANVVLQDGLVHDEDHGQCFQRMCLTLPRARLQVALERIAKEF